MSTDDRPPMRLTAIEFPSGQEFDSFDQGFVSKGPITITGYFLGADQEICPICRKPFTLREPQPTMSVQDENGTAWSEEVPICSDCVIRAIEQSRL